MKHTIMWLQSSNKVKIGYRDVVLDTDSNEVESVKPVERVY